jgi:hypothetical protein
MDNILKLLLSVLGVAGLIAMVTSNMPYDQQQPEAIAPPPLINPPLPTSENGGDALPEESLDAESPEEDGEDVLSIGEPMIDGQPYGSSNQQAPQNEGPMPVQQPADNFSYGQGTAQGYSSMPPIYVPQPGQDTSITPVYNGG